MNIVINVSPFVEFFNLSPGQMFWVFFVNFGWLIMSVAFLSGARQLYLYYIQNKWAATHRVVLLAIDVPKGNEQTPRAVENMFTYLSGAHGSTNFFEKWFEGKFQKSFSYEIVSLEGYTQFLIRTPAEFRNLVESSVYSQYPDAEISEVEDYMDLLPKGLPDHEYDVWGTEFVQKGPSALPIRTYPEFEYKLGPLETQFKDPMATLMDLCSSLRHGEYLGIQLIVIPTGFDWLKDSEAAMDKILNRKAKPKPGLLERFIVWLGEMSEAVFSIWGEIDPKGDAPKPKLMTELSPQELKQLNMIQMKASKLSFEVKIRVIYIARREVVNKAKVANGVVGYMKQFAALDLNNLKPDVDSTMTKAQYFFQKKRLLQKQRLLYSAYAGRSGGIGRNPGIFNIEELATLWHFPIEASVKAAMVQKAPGRKADAPSDLPLEPVKAATVPDIFTGATPPPTKSVEEEPPAAAAPPINLPFA